MNRLQLTFCIVLKLVLTRLSQGKLTQLIVFLQDSNQQPQGCDIWYLPVPTVLQVCLCFVIKSDPQLS